MKLTALPSAAVMQLQRSEAGTVARTVQSKAQDVLSVFDFMTTAQISDVRAGTGALDVTTALQAALDYVSADGNGPRSHQLYFPGGAYRISSTLNYTGAVSHGVHLCGEIGGTAGPLGARLIWYGSSGGTMLYLLGINSSTIQHLELQGRSLAKYGIHVDATNAEGGSVGATGVVFERVSVTEISGAGSACIALNHANALTSQTDNIDFLHCHLAGGAACEAGVKTFNSGNVKQFRWYGGAILDCDYLIDWLSASACFIVIGMSGGNSRIADFRLGNGNLTLIGVETEGLDGSRFVTGATGANGGSLVCQGCSWECNAAADDVMISYTGAITLIGNIFQNLRTGSSVPRVVVGSALLSTNAPAAIISIGNQYVQASGIAPFYDGSGNQIFEVDAYYSFNNFPINVCSWGDYGGTGGAIVHLDAVLPGGRTPGGIQIGAQGTRIKNHLSATKTWNPANLADGAQTSTTLTVTGAAVGNEVTVGFSQPLQGLQLWGEVSAPDTLTIYLRNGTGGAIDLASGTLSGSVWQH